MKKKLFSALQLASKLNMDLINTGWYGMSYPPTVPILSGQSLAIFDLKTASDRDVPIF